MNKPFIIMCWITGMASAGYAAGPFPLPGRNILPTDATPFFKFMGTTQDECTIRIKGKEVSIRGGEGTHRLAPVPRGQYYIYATTKDNKGYARVWQDLNSSGSNEIVLSLRVAPGTQGKCLLQAYYSQHKPQEPEFVKLLDLPTAVQPPDAANIYLWGEKSTDIRTWAASRGFAAFTWHGEVDTYATLGYNGDILTLYTCGDDKAKTLNQEVSALSASFPDCYLLLSDAEGPGRIHVIQQMNVVGCSEAMVEINDKAVDGVSSYTLTAVLVPKIAVDLYYRPKNGFQEQLQSARQALSDGKLSEAADQWSWIATHTQDKMTRLWAIEKCCMLHPYPAADFSEKEKRIAAEYQQAEQDFNKGQKKGEIAAPLEILRGKNAFFAWPVKLLDKFPAKWYYLAQTDMALNWLESWTQKRPTTWNESRMFVCFHPNDKGHFFWSGYTVYFPRWYMGLPVVPDFHEMSHPFAECYPILHMDYLREGLTDLFKNSCQNFLGRNDECLTFRTDYMQQFGCFMCDGRDISNVDNYSQWAPYNVAGGFYFVLLKQLCNGDVADADWQKWGELLKLARECSITLPPDANREKKLQLFCTLCIKAFGPQAKDVLQKLKLPTDEPVAAALSEQKKI